MCPGGVQSWGKKRRRKREVSTEIPILPDYPLVAAIVVEGAPYGNATGPTDSQYVGKCCLLVAIPFYAKELVIFFYVYSFPPQKVTYKGS